MKLANPFLTVGYAGPEYFCDRKQETEELIRHLDNDRNTTLISPRRYGKTGLIRQVLHFLSKRRGMKTVYVDLYPTRNLSDFTRALAVARSSWGQVCSASRGKVKKLWMDENAGAGADVSIRALRGSGGLESP